MSALFLSYIMWRSNFTILHSFAANICTQHLPPIFVAYVCRLYLLHIFAAYICRQHLQPIFWKSAYILRKRLHFEQAPIFFACANILGKRQYFDDFCNKFCLILLLQIFVYIFSIYLCIFMCANIFCPNGLKPRFKMDVVIMII